MSVSDFVHFAASLIVVIIELEQNWLSDSYFPTSIVLAHWQNSERLPKIGSLVVRSPYQHFTSHFTLCEQAKGNANTKIW